VVEFAKNFEAERIMPVGQYLTQRREGAEVKTKWQKAVQDRPLPNPLRLRASA
jgi:hypothetical protein